MKRLLLLPLLMLSSMVWAQVQPDSTRAAGRELDGGMRSERGKVRNVIGAPVYYDTLGNVLGRETTGDSIYRRPKHHFRNRLEDHFCAYFLEGSALMGTGDMALGATFGYLPQRWGAYGTVRMGVRNAYVSAGPMVRMSDCDNFLDWHFYAGVTVGRRVGGEIGFRMASPIGWERFCPSSVSMGAGIVDGYTFFTIGLSIDMFPLTGFLFW